ncbi:hypothetical protein R5W23_000116 [Gemmata sp. JC673]|uniref:Uncharacterized protein n=1 Tax=Gemmata algarum TaxID=2975278 RepID=A0ABU5EQP9_9BACT|nr:hypothetical protein [Gemmata algarum]MDY3557589.1 hypothetical protein [Gemmata algarum]
MEASPHFSTFVTAYTELTQFVAAATTASTACELFDYRVEFIAYAVPALVAVRDVEALSPQEEREHVAPIRQSLVSYLHDQFSDLRWVAANHVRESMLPQYERDVAELRLAVFAIVGGGGCWDAAATYARHLLSEFVHTWWPYVRDEPVKCGPQPGAGDPLKPAGETTGQVSAPPPSLRTQIELAVEQADLSNTEAKVVRYIAKQGGKAAINDVKTACDCDFLSAFKRAKEPMKKKGWLLRQRNSELRIESLQTQGQK